MFVAISNEPRAYAWGSVSAIAELMGSVPSGGPEAELWFGAHSGSPARITDPAAAGGARDLAEWIAADPTTTLGPLVDERRLPFLLKVLAADAPLSLQAHPTVHQAQEGFVRETTAGIPLSSPERNYKDPFSKPEMIFAISPTFDALCGFRRLEETKELVAALAAADDETTSVTALLTSLELGLQPTVEWLAGRGDGVQALVSAVVRLARIADGFPREFATVLDLEERYPGDPGIVISLLLNRVTLSAGQALYLPAGNIHAYLHGLGIELMASSDNVLRGGLTPKHVDVPELLRVLDFRVTEVPYLIPAEPQDGVQVFSPAGAGFELVRLSSLEAMVFSWSLNGPALLLCTGGVWHVGGAVSDAQLSSGCSVYVTPDEGTLQISGEGELFLATVAPEKTLSVQGEALS